MCEIVEEYANEIALETAINIAKNLFENGGSLELGIATFKTLSEAQLIKIYQEVTDAKL